MTAALAAAPQQRAAGDSWEAFGKALWEESVSLHRLNIAAFALTRVLVSGTPETITQADRVLNAERLSYQSLSSRRRGMQVRGFGTMTLRQVCGYAPRQLAPTLNQRLAELTYGSMSLGITIKNNKSLIAAGLERLMRITGKLQEGLSERSGVYKRRGFVAPPGASVIVSSKV